jgi:hypothetical protein
MLHVIEDFITVLGHHACVITFVFNFFSRPGRFNKFFGCGYLPLHLLIRVWKKYCGGTSCCVVPFGAVRPSSHVAIVIIVVVFVFIPVFLRF